MITVAIPTGTLLEGSLDLLRRAGALDLSPEEIGRRLLVERGGLRLVLVKPADVSAYVDYGSADLGIVGKDQLWESPGDHYELLDLGFGGCTLVVAVPESSLLQGPETWPPALRVATKYPRATTEFMARVGQNVEVIHLHGSVELAPQVGLVDAIVDLTQTGRTLRENHLRVVAVVGDSTARLIANQASLKTRAGALQRLVGRLRASLEDASHAPRGGGVVLPGGVP
ncbi:MAG TPA: ATP phosphoribosyltransferase [Candidatus Dormibacteraeota bacterium]|nr:ATP phosphoribosyltransferase [Candidatus Dormibacteraeota bacterium]